MERRDCRPLSASRVILEDGVTFFGASTMASSVGRAACIANRSRRISERLAFLEKYKRSIIKLGASNQTTFSERLAVLYTAWKSVAPLVDRSTKEARANVLHWVMKHTLHIMLEGDWPSPSAKHLRDLIHVCILETINKIRDCMTAVYRCHYILTHYNNPWGGDLLTLLQGDASLITEKDISILTVERGCMIILRVQKLCETKCEELALTLVSKALLAIRAGESSHCLLQSISEKQMEYLFDSYLCLLHKFRQVPKIIEEIKRLSLASGLAILERCMKHQTDRRLGKYRSRVAKLAADILTARSMVEELVDSEHTYTSILTQWLRFNIKLPVAEFRQKARKVFQTAISKYHLHLACDIIKKMEVTEWRELLLELYVCVITSDLNDLEQLKSEKDCDEQIVITCEREISSRFVDLADLLKTHSALANECILTAFSLNPTQENYQLVQESAHQWYSNSSHHTSAVEIETIIFDSIETMDLPNHIRVDLSVLLSSPRLKILSWTSPWQELSQHCAKLLKQDRKLEIVRQGMADANDKLQYLNLDYNQFRHLPEADCPGIEKGYEVYEDSPEDDYDEEENDDDSFTATNYMKNLYGKASGFNDYGLSDADEEYGIGIRRTRATTNRARNIQRQRVNAIGYGVSGNKNKTCRLQRDTPFHSRNRGVILQTDAIFENLVVPIYPQARAHSLEFSADFKMLYTCDIQGLQLAQELVSLAESDDGDNREVNIADNIQGIVSLQGKESSDNNIKRIVSETARGALLNQLVFPCADQSKDEQYLSQGSDTFRKFTPKPEIEYELQKAITSFKGIFPKLSINSEGETNKNTILSEKLVENCLNHSSRKSTCHADIMQALKDSINQKSRNVMMQPSSTDTPEDVQTQKSTFSDCVPDDATEKAASKITTECNSRDISKGMNQYISKVERNAIESVVPGSQNIINMFRGAQRNHPNRAENFSSDDENMPLSNLQTIKTILGSFSTEDLIQRDTKSKNIVVNSLMLQQSNENLPMFSPKGDDQSKMSIDSSDINSTDSENSADNSDSEVSLKQYAGLNRLKTSGWTEQQNLPIESADNMKISQLLFNRNVSLVSGLSVDSNEQASSSEPTDAIFTVTKPAAHDGERNDLKLIINKTPAKSVFGEIPSTSTARKRGRPPLSLRPMPKIVAKAFKRAARKSHKAAKALEKSVEIGSQLLDADAKVILEVPTLKKGVPRFVAGAVGQFQTDLKPLINTKYLPEIKIKRLDNLTLLKYRQSILVDGSVIGSPVVRLTRIKDNFFTSLLAPDCEEIEKVEQVDEAEDTVHNESISIKRSSLLRRRPSQVPHPSDEEEEEDNEDKDESWTFPEKPMRSKRIKLQTKRKLTSIDEINDPLMLTARPKTLRRYAVKSTSKSIPQAANTAEATVVNSTETVGTTSLEMFSVSSSDDELISSNTIQLSSGYQAMKQQRSKNNADKIAQTVNIPKEEEFRNEEKEATTQFTVQQNDSPFQSPNSEDT